MGIEKKEHRSGGGEIVTLPQEGSLDAVVAHLHLGAWAVVKPDRKRHNFPHWVHLVVLSDAASEFLGNDGVAIEQSVEKVMSGDKHYRGQSVIPPEETDRYHPVTTYFMLVIRYDRRLKPERTVAKLRQMFEG